MSEPATAPNDSEQPAEENENTQTESKEQDPGLVPSVVGAVPPSVGVYPVIEKAELAGGYFSKYVTFVIKTPAGVAIKRRYSDFEWLRSWFTRIFVGAFVPPIPPKLPVAMWPRGYLLMRKRELQAFLQRCYIIPYLKNEAVFDFFLTQTSDGRFDKACKKWDKTHQKPSVLENIEKIKATFPEIANAEIPENLEEMCASSRECVGQIVVCLDKAVISCEGIITSQDAVSRSLQELVGMTTEMLNDENCLHRSDREADQKFAERYVNKTRLDPTHEVLQWSELNKQTSQTLRLHTLPVLRKSLNDIRVMNEAIIIRDKLRSDHDLAQTIAAKWKTEAAKTNLRTNQVEQKHRDEQFEMETKELSELVSKVVLSQLNLVWEANLRRWSNGCTNLHANVTKALEQLRSTMADAATLWERDTSPRPPHMMCAIAEKIVVEKKPEEETAIVNGDEKEATEEVKNNDPQEPREEVVDGSEIKGSEPEVAVASTNPFAEDKDTKGSETNPFVSVEEDEPPPVTLKEDTNPFLQKSDSTNPFDEDNRQDSTNPFDDEPVESVPAEPENAEDVSL